MQQSQRTPEGEHAYAEYLKEWHSEAYQRRLEVASQRGAAAQVYERLAGEVEARDVQARLGISSQERANVRPAVASASDQGRDELVVVFSGGEQNSENGLWPAPVFAALVA